MELNMVARGEARGRMNSRALVRRATRSAGGLAAGVLLSSDDTASGKDRRRYGNDGSR
jgi:hypothetical protein